MVFQALAFEQPVILRTRCVSILCLHPRNLRTKYLTMEVHCVVEFLPYEPCAGPVHSGAVVLGVWNILPPYRTQERKISASFFFFSNSLNW